MAEIKGARETLEVTDSILTNASFDNVNLSNSAFNNMNLSVSRFTDINFANTSIDNANLTGQKRIA